MEISEIRRNIINNFLNPGYKNACVSIPSMIIGTIAKNSWFPVEYDDKNDALNFHLGNDLVVTILIVWKKSKDENKWHLKEFI